MKNVKMLAVFVFIATLVGCKNEKKEASKEAPAAKEHQKESMLMAQAKDVTIKWTAYKTTEKTPVSGTFKKVDFNMKHGKTPEEVLDGLQFSILASSVFSDNEVRDKKLVASFFGAMLDTELIKGSLNFSPDKKLMATIEMNKESHSFPLDYTVSGDVITMKGVMNLEDWKALGAIASLNKVCFDLHKGADGISKTWNDVAVDVTLNLSHM
jgi:hypothetical protein